MKNKLIAVITIIFTIFNIIGCKDGNLDKDNQYKNIQYKEACTTPFKRYPETITYTLGKMTQEKNSNMPLGDTYENNAYTRYIKDKLNVQNKDEFEACGTSYDNMVSIAISQNKIPDIMIVDNYQQLKMLVENDMIEDLSESYKNCASDRIKNMYKSYGNKTLDEVTFNGKLMALPDTNIEQGPNMLWLRKDWMDKLNLKEPKTLKDAEYIISQFIEKDPGKNGYQNTVGLVCSPEITSDNGWSYMTQTDIIFANFNSYPKQWVKDKNGNAVYGYVVPESKQALAYMRELYRKGILDKKFLLRGQSNIQELIIDGKCGSFFGLWWAPNNPLIDSVKKDKNAVWMPYMISTNKDGSTSFIEQNPTCKYVVVRKGYKHPEIVMKINSVLFDEFKSTDKSLNNIALYYKNGIDPTARPLGINIDYENALFESCDNISRALRGEVNPSSLPLIDNSYYEQCCRYLNDKEKAEPEDWATYTCRIIAPSTILKAKVNKVDNVFLGETQTMTKLFWKLRSLETEAYLKIITGEEPLDYFDTFVDKWYEDGGREITYEVNEEINKNK